MKSKILSKSYIENLKMIQHKISESILIPSENIELDYFDYIVGIDLAFESNKGMVCFSVFNTKNKKIKYYFDVDEVTFPYIPGFLAFRELPIIIKLYDKVKCEISENTLFFVDGHGLSHPRKAGIATHFGVTTNSFSIGIAKKILYGKISKPNFLQDNQLYHCTVINSKGNVIAIAIKTSFFNRNKIMNSKTLFLSIGNKLNLKNSFELFILIYRNYGFIPTELAHNYLQKIKKQIKQQKSF